MQYETVNIALRKTSSAYYARKRAEAGTRYCAYCGKQLVRRYYDSGRYESDRAFLRRQFCNPQCYAKSKAEGRKEEREAEIAEQYRKCRSVEGLWVDEAGSFIYHGKPKKVSRYVYKNGRKRTALVVVARGGKSHAYQAARLGCDAFKPDYNEDCLIEYVDGDIHNIAAGNLRPVRREIYNKAMMSVVSSYRKIGTARYQIERLRNVISGARAVLNFFETGDISELNRFVSDELHPLLVAWCVHSLHYSKERAVERAADAIARFYEVILCGHAVSYPERYCKMLLQEEKRWGEYPHRGNFPKDILALVHEAITNKDNER